MKVAYLIVKAIILLLASSRVLALDDNQGITLADMGYQYWVYSVTWQPSFCKLKPDTTGCDQPPQKFLTHGIWPYNNSTDQKTNRHPAFCNTAPSGISATECDISDTVLSQIIHKPKITGLVTIDRAGMFKHEWKEHGTCSGKPEEDYVDDIAKPQKVIIYNEAEFNARIDRGVMFDTIKTAFPSNSTFRCFVQADKQYLHEVFYRINPDGTPYEDDATLQIGIPCKSQETFISNGI